MACPYFMPLERLENGSWPHPERLPLGGGWTGHCTAPQHENEIPPQHIVEAFCNLGYATSCPWAPAERPWDAVRFAISAPQKAGRQDRREGEHRSRSIRIVYVCERNHLPAEHGELEFNLQKSIWLTPHPDMRLQKMAECFLKSQMKKND